MNFWKTIDELRQAIARATPIAGPGIRTESTALGTRIIAVASGGGSAAAEAGVYPFKVWVSLYGSTWYWCVSRITPPGVSGTWTDEKAGRVTLFPFAYDRELDAVQWTAFNESKLNFYLKATADGTTCQIVNEAARSSLIDDTGAKTIFYFPLATLSYANSVLSVGDELRANVTASLPVWV